MTTTIEKADDDLNAFDALESEEKEFIKVGNIPDGSSSRNCY
jgi:hypothetical protein